MASNLPAVGGLHVLFTVVFVLVGFLTLIFTFSKSTPQVPPARCTPSPLPVPAEQSRADRPLMLIWFWPEDYGLEFGACRKYFGIDGCRLTNDRALYMEADEVLFHHKDISDDLSNMPKMPRPGFQRWIWMNLDPPENTRRIKGLDKLFNLSLTFRQDSDIQVRWRLLANRDQNTVIPMPTKEHLVCWVESDTAGKNNTGFSYYQELTKHMDVHIVPKSTGPLSMSHQGNRSPLSSCKFVLAFENVIYRDYITERFHAPLAAGAVPVALGPPRQNYEDFAPGESFIHVNDFADAQSLSENLMRIGRDEQAYLRYFQWRRSYTAERHFPGAGLQYLKALCLACDHVGKFQVFRTIPSLYKWYFG